MSVRHQPGRHGDGLRSERGSAAMLAAVGMALLLVITLSFVGLAQLETKIGVNRVQEIRAIQAAEAGARRVYAEIAAAANGPSYWLANGRYPNPYLWKVRVDSAATATYSVWIRDNSVNPTGPDTDSLVAVSAKGESGGASRSVTLLVQPSDYAPTDAIRVNSQLKIPGSPIVQGDCGSVHVADAADVGVDIDTSGAPVVQQGISTNGSGNGDYYKTKYPVPSGSKQVNITTGVPPRWVPKIDPKRYAKYADYILNSDGYAYQYDPSASGRADPGTFCTSKTSECSRPLGWIKLDPAGYSPGQCILGYKRQAAPASNGPAVWVDCGAAAGGGSTPGTFYVKGGWKMSNSPGTAADPYHLTVITEADIEISGSPTIIWDNLTTTSTPVASLNPLVPRDTLFVAGTDLKFAGSLGEYVQGMIAAHEQINISGSGTLNGIILGEDACHGLSNWPTCDGTLTLNTISGSPHVNYDCGLKPAEVGTPAVVAQWMSQ